jgi:hypothetical protein
MATDNNPTLMEPAEFEKMFLSALTDEEFQRDIMNTGIEAVTKRGYKVQITPAIHTQLMIAARPIGGGGGGVGYRCGVCGVCGVCSLCGEINAGSASAALWALFALGVAPPLA